MCPGGFFLCVCFIVSYSPVDDAVTSRELFHRLGAEIIDRKLVSEGFCVLSKCISVITHEIIGKKFTKIIYKCQIG